jgi:hypothetical protein
MNTKQEIMAAFRAGTSLKEMESKFSTKTIFRYRRLWLLLQIKNKLQEIADFERWGNIPLPNLKRLWEEIEGW